MGSVRPGSDHLAWLHQLIKVFSADLAQDKGGFFEAELVVVGQKSANRAEILQGVRSGDRLLSGNTAKLHDALIGK